MGDLHIRAAERLVVSPWVLGTNLFHGPESPADGEIPIKATFCILDAGPMPEPDMGSVNDLRVERCKVVLRENRDQTDYGLATARAHLARLRYAELTGFIDVRVLETEPNYLGDRGDGHPRWSFNVEALREEAL